MHSVTVSFDLPTLNFLNFIKQLAIKLSRIAIVLENVNNDGKLTDIRPILTYSCLTFLYNENITMSFSIGGTTFILGNSLTETIIHSSQS